MVAKYGDAFYPVANYFAGPIDGGQIGVEFLSGPRARRISGLAS
jgi:hypothetical protein